MVVEICETIIYNLKSIANFANLDISFFHHLVADIWWNVSLDGSGVGEIPHWLFCKLIIVAEIPRAAEISENLR